MDRRFLVHWQGRPTSDDSWISEDALRRLRPKLIQPLEEVLHTNSTEQSSSHPGRMMGDHPDDVAPFPEDRISVCLQPRREVRANTREPDFKYPANGDPRFVSISQLERNVCVFFFCVIGQDTYFGLPASFQPFVSVPLGWTNSTLPISRGRKP